MFLFLLFILLFPTLLLAQQPATTVTLAWDAPSAIPKTITLQQYLIYRHGVGHPYGVAVCTVPATVLTCTDTITTADTYTYTAVADYGTAGVSDHSNEITVPVTTALLRPPPRNLRSPQAQAPPIPPAGPYALVAFSQLKILSVDSQELVGQNNAATNAIDGNTATFWHTEWSQRTAPLPHTLVLDLGAQYQVDGLRYLPRQDDLSNGTIADYQIYVSPDGITWGSTVATGTFAADMTEKNVRFTARTGRYVRLVALSEMNGNPWTSAAEVGIFAVPAP